MKKLRFSINAKVALGILMILGSVMVVGLKVFGATHAKSTVYEESLSIYQFTCRVEEMKTDSIKLSNLIYNYNFTGKSVDARKYEASLEEMKDSLDDLFVVEVAEENKVVLNELEEIVNTLPLELDMQAQVLVSKDQGSDSDEITQEITENQPRVFVGSEVIKSIDSIDEVLVKFEEDSRDKLSLLKVESEEKESELMWWIMFGTVLCSSMAVFTALIVVFLVTRPLVKLTSVIENISRGDLATNIDKKILGTNDEIGDLSRAFDRTMVSLKLAMKKSQDKSKNAKKDDA